MMRRRAEFEFSDKILAVDIHGDLIATSSNDAQIRLDVLDGPPRFLLADTHFQAICLAFSPDGLQLAASDISFSFSVKIWNVYNCTLKFTLGVHCVSMAWMSDNDRLLTAFVSGEMILWSTKLNQQLHVYRCNGIDCLGISHDDQCIATGSDDEMIRLWQLDSDQPQTLLTGHQYVINNVAFHPKNSGILLSSCLRCIAAHDLQAKTLFFQLEVEGAFDLCWTRNGRYFLIREGEGVKLWNFNTHMVVARNNQPQFTRCMAIDQNANQYIIASWSKSSLLMRLPWFAYVDPLTVSAEQVNTLALLPQVLLHPCDDIITFDDLLQIQGVDVNAQDDDGDTALHVAMHMENQVAVKALQEANADVSIVNLANRTACLPLSIYDLLPPELWAHIVITFCPMLSVQSFSHTCREARYLLTADEGGYAHRVLARRGLDPIIEVRSIAAFRILARRRWREIELILSQKGVHWPEAFEFLRRCRFLAQLQESTTQN